MPLLILACVTVFVLSTDEVDATLLAGLVGLDKLCSCIEDVVSPAKGFTTSGNNLSLASLQVSPVSEKTRVSNSLDLSILEDSLVEGSGNRLSTVGA